MRKGRERTLKSKYHLELHSVVWSVRATRQRHAYLGTGKRWNIDSYTSMSFFPARSCSWTFILLQSLCSWSSCLPPSSFCWDRETPCLPEGRSRQAATEWHAVEIYCPIKGLACSSLSSDKEEPGRRLVCQWCSNAKVNFGSFISAVCLCIAGAFCVPLLD